MIHLMLVARLLAGIAHTGTFVACRGAGTAYVDTGLNLLLNRRDRPDIQLNKHALQTQASSLQSDRALSRVFVGSAKR